MRVRIVTTVAALALVLPVVTAADLLDRVLAVVSGTVITQSDAAAALAFGLVAPPAPGVDPLRAVLDQLIHRELILTEVNRYAPTEADADLVKKKLAEIRDRFPSPAAFQAALARTAMNQSRLADVVEGDVRIGEYLKQRFGVAEPTDQELSAYYGAHRAEFTSGGRQLTLEQARDGVRQRWIEEKRTALIGEWVARLRRRAEVSDLYFADTGK